LKKTFSARAGRIIVGERYNAKKYGAKYGEIKLVGVRLNILEKVEDLRPLVPWET